MKFGIEAEGRLRGVRTIFMNADEAYLLMSSTERLDSLAARYKAGHLYISDHENTLNYEKLGDAFFDYQITLEVTKVRDDLFRPLNVYLMLALPEKYWHSIVQLGDDDQLKVSHNQNVIVAPANAFIYTEPHEFEDDEEIK